MYFRRVARQEFQRTRRKNDAEAEGGIAPIPLNHDDVVLRSLSFQRQREEQAGRSRPDYRYTHCIVSVGRIRIAFVLIEDFRCGSDVAQLTQADAEGKRLSNMGLVARRYDDECSPT